MPDQPFLSILHIGVWSGASFWQLSLGNNSTTSNSIWQLLATATQPILPRKGHSIGIRQGHQSGACSGASLLEQTLRKQLWHPAKKRELSVKLSSALLAWPSTEMLSVTATQPAQAMGAQRSCGDPHLFSNTAPLNCWLRITLEEALFTPLLLLLY